MKNKEFDDIIRNKLESLNTEGTVGSWDLFKEKWDSESGLADVGDELSSEDQEFDDVIKNKLESLNTAGTVDAWDLFKEKWDSESSPVSAESELSSEDQDLDAKIKMDMQKLRIPFNSKHWIILKEQLELEALFKKKLFVAKSVELIILGFLVIGILNLLPIQNDIYQIPVYDNPMVASVPVDKETAERHEAQEEERLTDQIKLNQQYFNTTKKIVQKAIRTVDVQPLSFAPLEKNIELKSKKTNTGAVQQNNVRNVINDFKSAIHFPFIHNSVEISNREIPEKLLTKKEDNHSVALLEQKELIGLDIPRRPIGFPDIILVNKSFAEEGNTYLSFSIGPKINLINSPFDPVYEIDPYNTINTNFNISAKLQKDLGPLEMYLGLGYTNTSYVPQSVDEVYEPKERQFSLASLESIKFKTFNVPVGVRYNLIDSKKIQLYAAAGVDVNIIADSDYKIKDIPVGSRSEPSYTAQGSSSSKPGNSNNSPINPNAKLSQKEFNQGILSGGSLRDNLYATASVGLGLNWNVSARSGIFIEPRYSHFISSNGIGPNADKVHAVSIDLGVRYQL